MDAYIAPPIRKAKHLLIQYLMPTTSGKLSFRRPSQVCFTEYTFSQHQNAPSFSAPDSPSPSQGMTSLIISTIISPMNISACGTTSSRVYHRVCKSYGEHGQAFLPSPEPAEYTAPAAETTPPISIQFPSLNYTLHSRSRSDLSCHPQSTSYWGPCRQI
jgi:hypothetical protein